MTTATESGIKYYRITRRLSGDTKKAYFAAPSKTAILQRIHAEPGYVKNSLEQITEREASRAPGFATFVDESPAGWMDKSDPGWESNVRYLGPWTVVEMPGSSIKWFN